MSRHRCIAALSALAALTAAVTTAAGQTAASRPATAVAQAFVREDPSGDRTGQVSVKDGGEKAADGARVTASTGSGRGTATSVAGATDVDLFDGLVTVKSVRVRADADADGTATSGSISGLAIEGRAIDPPTERTAYDLNGYGRLVALGSGRTGILGLRARLTKPYNGHQPGDVVRVAYASAHATNERAAPAAAPKPAAPAAKRPKKARKRTAAQRARRALEQRRRSEAGALLASPGYAFPVAGEHGFTDDWGAPRQDTGTHEGNDVFAAFGTPIVAVADGRLYRVGTRKIPGNRLWLRDHKGRRFFYAHLSDFAAAAYNGADVHAGEVIGFVGSTGDAEQTPPHLHFEVHLADRTAINPFRFLTKWEQSGVGTARWVSRYGKDPGVRPGALVVVKDFLAG